MGDTSTNAREDDVGDRDRYKEEDEEDKKWESMELMSPSQDTTKDTSRLSSAFVAEASMANNQLEGRDGKDLWKEKKCELEWH